MNIRRTLSYLVVIILAAVLWTIWVKEHPQKTVSQDANQQQVTGTVNKDDEFYAPPKSTGTTAVSTKISKVDTPSGKVEANTTQGGLIQVKTDVLSILINKDGGNIVTSQLPKYTLSLEDSNPVTLMSSNPNSLYQAQSGLQMDDGQSVKILYQTQYTSYELTPDAKQLTVNLVGKTPQGLEVTKSYVFERGSYAVKLNYVIKNTTGNTWSGRMFTQFIRKKQPSESHMFVVRSYEGASISSPETPYEKVSFKDMEKNSINRTNSGGWVAMQQHYFLSAWIPENQQQQNQFYTKADSTSELYLIGFLGPVLTVTQGQTVQQDATLYLGPEIQKILQGLAPGLDRTVDYGWLWWVSIIIFWLMNFIHSGLGNWGWAIVITTIIIKFVLYPLSATSFRSMAKMRELQPKMQKLKEKFGDDRQAMSRATMELYRKEKINPLGGCLPMLIQIPIFIGLYYVIIESVQLRQAPFIWWIQDLAVKDPYYVLPILMGASMVLQQRLAPSSADPAQARMMMFLPVVFTIFFLNFPAGLTLYWLVNNCVQILQQWYVTRTYEAHKAKKARKSKSKSKKSNITKSSK